MTQSGEFIGPALIGTALCFAGDIALCGATVTLLDSVHSEWVILPVAFSIGLLAAQGVLAAMWLTFATSRLAIRLPISLAIVLLIVFTWFIGLAIGDQLPGIEFFFVTAGFCFLLFALLVLPFWITQRVSQRRMMLWYEPIPVIAKEQFSVRYILITTAGVAGLVTLGQLIFVGESWSGDLNIRARTAIGISTIVFWIAAYVLTIVWSMMWMILVEESRKFVWLLSIVAALAISPFVVSESLFALAGRPGADEYPWIIAGACMFGVAILIVTAIALSAAHSWGFRLIRTDDEGTSRFPTLDADALR